MIASARKNGKEILMSENLRRGNHVDPDVCERYVAPDGYQHAEDCRGTERASLGLSRMGANSAAENSEVLSPSVERRSAHGAGWSFSELR